MRPLLAFGFLCCASVLCLIACLSLQTQCQREEIRVGNVLMGVRCK